LNLNPAVALVSLNDLQMNVRKFISGADAGGQYLDPASHLKELPEEHATLVYLDFLHNKIPQQWS
jgi:hypothetical protein